MVRKRLLWFGSGLRTSATNATLINSFLVRFLDYNDGGGGGHNSDAISAILATSEREKVGGRDFLTSIVISYEIGARFEESVFTETVATPYALSLKGWMNDIRGGLNMPPALGKIMGLNEEQIANAIGICVNDPENHPSRYAGRGGMGAVLGSKGLKAVIIDDKGCPDVPIVNKQVFDAGRKKLIAALQEHALTKPGGALNTYGTAVLVNIINEAGAFPTRNFRDGRFERAAKISGETINEICKKRGGVGMTGHSCSPGCIIMCSNVYPKPDGTELVSVQEYESVWSLGANCGIDDLDVTGELIRLCNDYGVDTIEAGVAIGVAMEAGLAKFGDGKKAIELMHEIGKGTSLGHILGNGAEVTAKVFGVVRYPTAKGQAMPAYDPRAIKGIGAIYATSTMGADHTSGYTICPEILGISGEIDKFTVEKADLVRNFLATTASFFDSSGHCLFIAFAVLDILSGLEGVVEECNGVLGTNWTVDDMAQMGKKIVERERAFNEAAGFTKAHDRLPEFMKYEKLPPHNVVFDMPDAELDKVHAP